MTDRSSPSVWRIVTAIVAGGVVGAAAIDLYLVMVESWIMHLATPLQVSQWDASNLLGRAAFFGGIRTASIGYAMHQTVSLCWAALFTFLALRVAGIRRYPSASGLIFGVCVMFAMRWFVVPLGHAMMAPLDPRSFAILIVAHALFFGLPVAVAVTRVLSRGSEVERGWDDRAGLADGEGGGLIRERQ
jgi:hypothetical protein